jgi:hypothetical protein
MPLTHLTRESRCGNYGVFWLHDSDIIFVSHLLIICGAACPSLVFFKIIIFLHCTVLRLRRQFHSISTSFFFKTVRPARIDASHAFDPGVPVWELRCFLVT